MLVLNIEDIDRLQAITQVLVEGGCGFAAVFAQYDGEARMHARSGDAEWYSAENDEPIRAAFRSVSVTRPSWRMGLTALVPTTDRGAACEAQVLALLDEASEVIRGAIFAGEIDQRDRRRTRSRSSDATASRRMTPARGRARADAHAASFTRDSVGRSWARQTVGVLAFPRTHPIANARYTVVTHRLPCTVIEAITRIDDDTDSNANALRRPRAPSAHAR